MIIIEKCNIFEGGILVILTSNSGKKESYTKLSGIDEFQHIATLVSPEETHDIGWERKEF